ncbi:unnamed protein product [Prunus armeniaca]|uniref:Bidirectional sugar transporter SWEET n=1 Tax=Prunus armeniaca TaxID=36596 RepID=A0A6J5XW33_PRUAR|nr:unnamed protein product [Prunus armeniaca]
MENGFKSVFDVASVKEHQGINLRCYLTAIISLGRWTRCDMTISDKLAVACNAAIVLWCPQDQCLLIISINGVGCVIEIIYLIFYIVYASKKDKITTMSLILLVNVAAFGLVTAVTVFLLGEAKRISAVGWMCAVFNIAVFAAPLSIMRQVIRTNSVEYMPFSLSFFLTLCATMWFFYGLFTKDYYIALPNVLGFLLGVVQMILYLTYKNSGKNDAENKGSQNMKEVHEPQPPEADAQC